MGFALKKFISFWLMPLPFCGLLLVVGLCLLLFSKRRRLARILLVTGTALLLLFSNKRVSMRLIRPLETLYPPVPELVAGETLSAPLANLRYIVVLGGGHGPSPDFSAVNQLSTSARGRLMEALRLARALPETQLVFCGHAGEGRKSHAAVLAEAAISLGFEPARMVRLENPRDTEDESIAIAQLVGSQRFALVTSAWHLRRAVALMRHHGLDPLPVPADFASRHPEQTTLSDYTWDTESLGRSTWAVREQIGYLWSRLRGKI
ncbi:MAG TPA: ElyC/SanA/YdcF family protein [Opitutus sp.]|nr:ElyC/SanA/YdcF family protein [Opitutus sp.]